jgi:hypothetical protein
MNAQSMPTKAIGFKLLIVDILAASLFTGSALASAVVAALAALYARNWRDVIGPGWMWLSLAIAALWLIGLGVLLSAPLPPGGSTGGTGR